MNVCQHDFAPLGTDRIFCRHCGEFRDVVKCVFCPERIPHVCPGAFQHVCPPCPLPLGWPAAPVNPMPYRYWWTTTFTAPHTPPHLVFNTASGSPDIDEHGNVI